MLLLAKTSRYTITLVWIPIILLGFVGSTASYKIMNETGAMKYLERFGYLSKEDMSSGMGMEETKPMLMTFQKMCNINMTGELDKKTMEMMNAPRCGNLDMVHIPLNASSNRGKRYAIHESKQKWKKREVTYKIAMYSEKMEKHVKNEDVLKAMEKAFSLWSEVTNLDFIHTPKSSSVDIEISFTTRFHPQDSFPFDGPGTTLAHAFAPGPGLGGDVHFEDEEDWRLGSPKGSDVLYVAVHEIGHALGLSHSDKRGAIMGAFYGGYRPDLALHPDDIEGIQKIYGKREVPTIRGPSNPNVYAPVSRTLPPTTRQTTTFRPAPTTPRRDIWTSPPFIPKRTLPKSDHAREPSSGRPDLCQDSKIDAITALKDGQVYVFKGNYVFQIEKNGGGVLPGWPNHINTVFPGLDVDIDAAATRDNGKTYFFKGKLYWRFDGTSMDRGYPKEIIKHFVGIPAYIESVFVWNGLFYFTKGDKFYTFDPKHKPHVDLNKYPLPIEVWGLPRSVYGIDAAFLAPNNHIYLFKDKIYYRIDANTFKISEAIPSYPRYSAVSWFGCSPNAHQSIRQIRKQSFLDYQDSSYYYSPYERNNYY